MLNRPLFPGKSAKEQLFEIIKILGTPTKENITNMNRKGKVRLKIPNIPKKNWKLVFKDKIDNDEFIDLVDKL